MITAKEAREMSSNSTKFLQQIEDLIKSAADEGLFEIGFYFLPQRDIDILKERGFYVSDAPKLKKVSMGLPQPAEKRTISW